MIPSVLSDQIKRGVDNYLKTTYQITTPHFNSLMDDFLSEEEDQLIKGPYLSLQLPFIKEKMDENPFKHIELPFPEPFRHQKRAFNRLSGVEPQPTIVATGTGSGKTEAFLLPILDYCAAEAGQKGIRAIFIYPMNALANDQAGRIAEYIYQNKATRGKVRAGLYVGRGQSGDAANQTTMTPDSIITSHEVLREDPPDILLTNYKMLDYLLLRPKDAKIWQYNEPETLRYLVVDELHTFDGAQGTDLACLIRRLKSRLKTPESYLCPVGTSATLGGNANIDRLLTYAKQVFGEVFTEDSVLTEYRMDPNQFFEDLVVEHYGIPEPDEKELNPDYFSTREEFIRRQIALWTGNELTDGEFEKDQWKLDLGKWLRQHQLFRQMLQIIDNRPILVRELINELENLYDGFRNNSRRSGYLLLNSFCLLISEAKAEEGSRLVPLINQVQQVWIREMRRMVASVSAEPKLRFAHDLNEQELHKHLPLLVCRDCGHTGWGGIVKEADRSVITELDEFYQGYFGNKPDTAFLFPKDENEEEHPGHQKLCTNCLQIHPFKTKECTACLTDEYLMEIHFYQETVQRKNYNKIVKDCPRCSSSNSLTIIGARSSTLSAVSISQFFASPYSGDLYDKRLLAFSDSVQDASHRSGFFTGRTYQFNFRAAIQQFLNKTNWDGTLKELPPALSAYYQGQFSSNEEYVAQFIPPDLQWMDDYVHLVEKDSLPPDTTILSSLRKRVEWEVFSEYGDRSLIGRTLQKSGSSMLRLDMDHLDNVVPEIAIRLREEIGTLRQISDQVVYQLVLGFMYNLRTRGGIYHGVLERYIREFGDNPYYTVYNANKWMPVWGNRSRTPSYLTNNQRAGRFQRLLSTERNTWHHRWAVKVLAQDAPLIEGTVSQVYDITLAQMVKAGLLNEHQVGNKKVWSIPSEQLYIDTNVNQLQCNRCGHQVQSTGIELEYWEESPCIQHHCRGSYSRIEQNDHYYQRLYADGHIKRIRSAEHTGLLNRTKKEDIEKKFKEQNYSWDPNLLSSTPTLEMGINIGGLNSVFLCSVPPSQASYVQRVGRAGRKSGSALNLTVAGASPHDLYFYSEPLHMVDGEIEPPGCFLNAVAVLVRQFFAFSIDRYVEQFGENANINRSLGQTIKAYHRKDHELFPLKFTDFLRANQKKLYDEFVALFSDDITGDTRNRLWEYIVGSEDVQTHLIGQLEALMSYKKDEVDSHRSQRKQINDNIRHREQNPVKPEDHEEIIKQLKREVAALGEFIRSLEREPIFQTLTNEGLIPNYAFPESGIKLKSIIYKKIGDDFDIDEYEYVRPASAGIREFAPDNTFYADGRKITIDQVNLQLSEPEIWRFCPSCHHTQKDPDDDSSDKCPRCGDPQWSDANQAHNVLELKQVMATASNKDSLSWDENEERDPKFYVKDMLVQIEENNENIHSAYTLETDRIPFGFEFIRDTRLLEINFGQTPSSNDIKMIAGNEVPSIGFEVCGKCGRVANERGEINHTRSCSNHGDEDLEKSCFYLYRELNSEALRILLPSSSYELDSLEHHSFNAAFYLGLKEYFEGDIDHLRTTYMQEQASGSNFHRHYLVLYDTVPGGTGYLKQLMEDKNNLKTVFEKALKVLRTCKCRTEEKPGCYECIYAYRHSFKMNNIESTKAIEILSKIIDKWSTIHEVETVKVVSSNKHLQSQLEERFVKRLDQSTLKGEKSYLIKDQVNGKDGWRWHWGDRIYRIEPQVHLGNHTNVPFNTSADFVIWPMDLPEVKKKHQKPIAIFTDGYTYHKAQLDDDFQKRCGIINETDFLVWNITWSDLQEEDPPRKGLFELNDGRFKKFVDQNINPHKAYVMNDDAQLWMGGNGFDTLLSYLKNPDPRHWNLLAHFLALSISSNGNLILQKKFDESIDNILENGDSLHPLWSEGFSSNEGEVFTNGSLYQRSQDILKAGFIFSISKDNLRPDTEGFKESNCIIKLWDSDNFITEKSFQDIWEGILHHMNILQMMSVVHVFTTRGIDNHRYSDWQTESTVYPSGKQDEYEDLLPDFKYLDEDLDPFINKLDHSLLTKAKVGFELLGDMNQVLAEAELAWEELKVAVLGSYQMEYRGEFEKLGWEIYTIEEVLEDTGQIFEKLNQETK